MPPRTTWSLWKFFFFLACGACNDPDLAKKLTHDRHELVPVQNTGVTRTKHAKNPHEVIGVGLFRPDHPHDKPSGLQPVRLEQIQFWPFCTVWIIWRTKNRVTNQLMPLVWSHHQTYQLAKSSICAKLDAALANSCTLPCTTYHIRCHVTISCQHREVCATVAPLGECHVSTARSRCHIIFVR